VTTAQTGAAATCRTDKVNSVCISLKVYLYIHRESKKETLYSRQYLC